MSRPVTEGYRSAARANSPRPRLSDRRSYNRFEAFCRPDLIRPAAFEEVLEQSDYISIHTPKTEETTNLFNRETLYKMKPGAMLINCARGGIVNEDDLYEALNANHLGGAALDVFETEPPGKICLMELDNLICSSHLGASTYEAQDNVARDVATQIIGYLKTGEAPNIVNLKE